MRYRFNDERVAVVFFRRYMLASSAVASLPAIIILEGGEIWRELIFTFNRKGNKVSL